MILAAGLGVRMRPLTDNTPKPLLPLAGKPMVVWQIEALARAGFTDITINTSHHADRWLPVVDEARRIGANITLLNEGEHPYESLGGICNMLRHSRVSQQPADSPFVVASGDVFTDFDYAALLPVLRKIEAGLVDAHFVLADNPPFHMTGDFAISDGLATRIGTRLNFAGITCWHPNVFRDVPPGTRERLFPWADALVAVNRVSAGHHRGVWENIGTPGQLAALQARLGAKMA